MGINPGLTSQVGINPGLTSQVGILQVYLSGGYTTGLPLRCVIPGFPLRCVIPGFPLRCVPRWVSSSGVYLGGYPSQVCYTRVYAPRCVIPGFMLSGCSLLG